MSGSHNTQMITYVLMQTSNLANKQQKTLSDQNISVNVNVASHDLQIALWNLFIIVLYS